MSLLFSVGFLFLFFSSSVFFTFLVPLLFALRFTFLLCITANCLIHCSSGAWSFVSSALGIALASLRIGDYLSASFGLEFNFQILN